MSARPYRDPCRDYASEARDDYEAPKVPPRPLYTPYRVSSHCWAFDTALGRTSGFDELATAFYAAANQQAEDEAECRDPGKLGMIAWTLRKALNIYPEGMSAAQNPYIETATGKEPA